MSARHKMTISVNDSSYLAYLPITLLVISRFISTAASTHTLSTPLPVHKATIYLSRSVCLSAYLFVQIKKTSNSVSRLD